MKRTGSIVYIVFFCVLLSAPGMIWLAGWNNDRPFADNRKPAECPVFDISSPGNFPGAYEHYFNDHFPYRNTGVFAMNYAQAVYFGKSPSPDFATIGTHGWLYPGDSEMRFLTGLDPLTDEEITAIIRELNERYEEAARLGAEYRLVVIPAKSTLYPEYMPARYTHSREALPMERFLARSANECKVPVLYLLDSLKAHKQEHKLYKQTDSHWSDIGAWYAYGAIIHSVYGPHPPQEIMPIVWSALIEEVLPGDLAVPLGLDQVPEYTDTLRKLSFNVKNVQPRKLEGYPCDGSWFTYCEQYEAAFQNLDTTLPGALIIRDSYCSTQFQELMANHFGRTTFIWDYWQHKLNKAIIANEKPKYVFCIMPEKFLRDFIKYPHAQETGGTDFLPPK